MSFKKHLLLTFSSSILQTIINFFSSIILTRVLGIEGRGVLFKIEASIDLISFFTTLKAHISIVFYTANKKISFDKLLGISLYFISFGIIATIILVLSVSLIGNNNLILPLGYDSLFFIIYFLLLFLSTQSELFVSAFLRGGKHFDKIFSYQIFSSIVKLIILGVSFSIVLYLGIHFSLKTGLLLHLSIAILTLLLSVIYYKKVYNKKPTFRLNYQNELKPFCNYSFISSLSIFMNFVNKSADIWVVEYFSGVLQLGLYAVAVSLSNVISLIPSTFRELLLPYFASDDKKDSIKKLIFLSRFNFSVLLLILFLLFIVSNHIIPILYGHEFQESIIPFQILLLGMLFNGPSILFSAYNYGTSKSKLNLYSNMIGVFFTVVLDFVLIPKYGIIGAAIASTISYIIASIFIFYTVIKLQKLPLTNYFILEKKDLLTIFNIIQKKHESYFKI